MMMALGSNCSSSLHTTRTCNSLLKELQQIWSEIGETEADKDRMLVELEQECLGIYRRKVEEAANAKAVLHQSIAAREAEVAMLMATLGDMNIGYPVVPDKRTKSLKGQLASVTPLVEELKHKKEERMKQFTEIKSQIDKISGEIFGYGHVVSSVSSLNLEEQDLSVRKLMEYQSNLRSLQKEKSERLQKVLDFVNDVHTLCSVLDLDFGKTVNEVHPSLHESTAEHVTNISDTTLEGLDQAVVKLKTQRKFRFQKLKEVATSLSDLWNLMDTPREDRAYFLRITSVLGFSESEIMQPGALSMEIIEQVSTEVERLSKLKAARLKELVMKKRAELEYICSKTHIEADPSTNADKTNALVDSGLVDPCELLANIEAQISKAKDDTSSRKEIMDKISRWLVACDEEKWLEEYNKDSKRYSAGKGVHINLKRAERARIMVNKIPEMVDNLIRQTLMWEDDKKMLFLYDGVRLVSILEDYKQARRRKEEEKKLARDQKKIHDMLLAEKESRFGSKPSPRRSNSLKNPNGYRGGMYGNGSVTPSPRRNSIGGTNSGFQTPRSYSGHQNGYFKEPRRLSTAPLNFVAIPKEDTISFSSVCGSEPESPQP